MGRYVNTKTIQEFANKGILIGSRKESYQTKGLGFKVFMYNKEVGVCNILNSYIMGGEIIDPNQIGRYVDDESKAIEKLRILGVM